MVRKLKAKSTLAFWTKARVWPRPLKIATCLLIFRIDYRNYEIALAADPY
jgi:hypothetical protein